MSHNSKTVSDYVTAPSDVVYKLTRPGYIDSDDYYVNVIRKPKPRIISPAGAMFDTREVEATIVLILMILT